MDSPIYFELTDDNEVDVCFGFYFDGLLWFKHMVSFTAKEVACPTCGIKCKCLDLDWFAGKTDEGAVSDPNNYFWR